MRLIVFILLVGVAQTFAAESYSQATKLTISMRNVSVEEVLDEIENTSEFYFLYNQKRINVEKKVNINEKGKQVQEVLDKLFNDTNVKYTIVDRQIVLTEDKAYSEKKAPQKSVTGKVTDETGEPLPGVTVAVKGTGKGAITDIDGKYTLNIDTDDATLVFSFIGMNRQAILIGNQSVVDVIMVENSIGLDEVVVTALGISKERKALGYVVQDVSGEDIKKTAETNVINALAGKSAGVYVNSSNGNVGASSRIVIRGNSSLKGNNQPLFVVDGVPIDNSIQSSNKGSYDFTDLGNGAADINPSDIAEMTILKGANAASLYGSRGANGVILITTKTGNKKGFSIEVENSTTFSNPLLLPDFQNQYGQGGGMQYWYKDGLNGGKNDGVDESFGPELDYVVQAGDIAPGGKLYWAVEAGFPQTVGEILTLPQFNSPIDPATGERVATPWISHPDNVKDYYETGVTSITNFALSNGGEWGNIRLSVTNSNQDGMTPNTYMDKNTFNFSGQTNLTEKLSFDTRASYVTSSGNTNGSGYTFNNIGMQTVWTGRQVDWSYMKTHVQNEDGTPISWISRWHDNPYWMSENFLNEQTKNRFIGSASLSYQFNDWLSFLARAGTDYSNQQVELKRAYYSINSKEGYYSVDNYFRQETNADFLFTARKEISNNLKISGNIGGNMMNKKYRSQGSTVARLVVPYVYSLSNAKDTPTTTFYQSEKEIQSLYGAFSMELWGQLFVDITGRNDWSSTLPSNANSYFYPSVNTSWVFTDALNLDNSIFTFGKIRLGWAQVGNDTDPYNIGLSYYASTPYGENPSFSAASTMPPLNLKNELITSTELGFDLKFFNNKLGLDATFYKSSAKNQIMSATMSATSGYGAATINAGQMDNKGIELILSANPVATKDFSWDVSINWSTNKNEVVSLNGDITKLNLYKTEGNQITVTAEVGGAYGDMWGKGFVYHENGKPIVDANGVPLTSELRVLGNVMPDWLGGISNSFSYKGFNFGFLIDAKIGGDIYSRTNQDGWATGALMSTIGLNDNGVPVRDPISEGGGYLFDGVFEDGTPNTIYKDLDGFRWNSFARAERWLYDASYVKLRQVSLSYSLPSSLLNKIKPLHGVDFGVFARNIAILYTKAENFDPEVSNKDASQSSQGSEFGSNPSARNIGFRVKFTF